MTRVTGDHDPGVEPAARVGHRAHRLLVHAGVLLTQPVPRVLRVRDVLHRVGPALGVRGPGPRTGRSNRWLRSATCQPALFGERPAARYGLTALCVGMGMGAALLWENLAAGH